MTFFGTLAIVVALFQIPVAVATFDGIFKSVDKKYVVVQVESGDSLRMYLTRGTKFVRDGKSVRATDFHDGEKVTVDTERDARMNLLAVKIENVKPETVKPDSEKQESEKPK